jgi:hypothetical protein
MRSLPMVLLVVTVSLLAIRGALTEFCLLNCRQKILLVIEPEFVTN